MTRYFVLEMVRLGVKLAPTPARHTTDDGV